MITGRFLEIGMVLFLMCMFMSKPAPDISRTELETLKTRCDTLEIRSRRLETERDTRYYELVDTIQALGEAQGRAENAHYALAVRVTGLERTTFRHGYGGAIEEIKIGNGISLSTTPATGRLIGR